MANTTLISSVLLLFSVFSLGICFSLTISTTEEKVPKVGDPCDGNEECGSGKCCVRLHPENGTVCQNLSVANAPCAETRLKEHTTTALPPLPSCRADEEAQAKPNYTHPYDKHCPCEKHLTCNFPQTRTLENIATKDNLLTGKCGNETLESQTDAAVMK
uniref:Putative secreted protein n=1 Tax=Amblyomma parvum TaxID=251391 RepID=A0A023G0A8_AMBPA